MRDFLTLADFRTPTLSIECQACNRHGRYAVARLIEQHGPDIKMPDLLPLLAADCPKMKAGGFRDRCRVRFGEDSRF